LFHISIIVIYPKNILAGHTTLHVKEIKTINMGVVDDGEGDLQPLFCLDKYLTKYYMVFALSI